jgi:hypothetical protein
LLHGIADPVIDGQILLKTGHLNQPHVDRAEDCNLFRSESITFQFTVLDRIWAVQDALVHRLRRAIIAAALAWAFSTSITGDHLAGA